MISEIRALFPEPGAPKVIINKAFKDFLFLNVVSSIFFYRLEKKFYLSSLTILKISFLNLMNSGNNEESKLTLGDFLKFQPIAEFKPDSSVLRLKDSNIFTLNSVKYELRLFTFQLKYGSPCFQHFGDYIGYNELENVVLVVPPNHPLPDILSYSVSDDSCYIILSVRKL